MTEKRFNIKPSAIVDDVTVIIDDEKKYSFPILDSTLNYMFCKALNGLTEEKEMWRRECERLKGLYYLKNGKTDEHLAWKRID